MKESKYRLRQRLKIKEQQKEKCSENIDLQLINAIEKNEFWEDIIEIIKKGADPKIKTNDNFSIWTGLERIFLAWAEDVANHWNHGQGEWDTEYEKSNLKYIKQEIDNIMKSHPGIDIDGLCYSGTFLNVICIEARKVKDISLFNDIISTLLFYGADPYNNDFVQKPIEWFSKRELPADSPLYIYQVKEQKKTLNEIIPNDDVRTIKTRM